MNRILMIEDDVKLREELAIFLKNNGYETMIFEEREDVVQHILESHADLILLDINLPFADGQHLCREIRRCSDVPIIMITSRNNEMDELISLSNGADQYVTKPYNVQILLAKIRGLLKRSQSGGAGDRIVMQGFTLNISQSSVETESDTVELSKNEFRILRLLAERKGTIVSRDDLMSYLWDNENFVDDNTLTVNIQRIRSKLAGIGLEHVIETKRGQGYMIR